MICNFSLRARFVEHLAAYYWLAVLMLLPGGASAQASVELISQGAPGLSANGASGSEFDIELFASADGRFVVFASDATDLADGLVDRNGQRDVFLRDRTVGTTILVSRKAGSPNTAANGAAAPAAISADGRFVAYRSQATDVVADVVDGNSQPDVFLFDRVDGTTTLVTRSAVAPTATANGPASVQAISADGNSLLFASLATDLVIGSDTNTDNDTFLWQRANGHVELVSHAGNSATTAANRGSFPVALSTDGRWTLFHTSATNLISGLGDNNASSDVFLYDRDSGAQTLVSRALESASSTANSAAVAKALSADGRFVAYESNATNVVAGIADANGGADVYAFDRAQGTTTLVSRSAASATTTANGRSSAEKISADGRWVLYGTEATNVAPDIVDAGTGVDAYLHDLQTGNTVLVTRSSEGPHVAINAGQKLIAISDGGDRVLWHSSTTFVISGLVDTNANQDVFLFERQTNSNVLLSRSVITPNHAANAGSRPTWLSGDGRFALYSSAASDLLPSGVDRNVDRDVYIYDDQGSGSELVSRRQATLPTTANAGAQAPVTAQSADGRWVLYSTTATNVVATAIDTNNVSDVYLRDTVNRSTQLISGVGGSSLVTANGPSLAVAVSSEGRWILFSSDATNILPGGADTNGAADIFVLDRDSRTITLVSHSATSATTTANRESIAAAMTPDGRWILFASQATNLIAGIVDTPIQDVFVYDRFTGATVLVSHSAGSAMVPGSAHSVPTAITPDGNFVAYYSYATNLVAGQVDANTKFDTFLYDRSQGITLLASRSAASPLQTADNQSYASAISDDGRWLLFGSDASDHLAGGGDNNGTADAYLYDRDTQSLLLVSEASLAGTTGNGSSFPVALSANGRRVLFMSQASDLIAGMVDNNGLGYDGFVYDRFDGSRTLISHTAQSPLHTGNRQTILRSISSDGLRVAFSSEADDLLVNLTDNNNAGDVFVYDLASATAHLISSAALSLMETANRGATFGTFSANGQKLLVTSRSDDLEAGSLDGNMMDDLYLVALPSEPAIFEDGFD